MTQDKGSTAKGLLQFIDRRRGFPRKRKTRKAATTHIKSPGVFRAAGPMAHLIQKGSLPLGTHIDRFEADFSAWTRAFLSVLEMKETSRVFRTGSSGRLMTSEDTLKAIG